MKADLDLFVDSNLSDRFCRPVDHAYRALIAWLCREGELLVCQSLINEYTAATSGSSNPTALVVLIGHLQRHGRLKRYTKSELRDFRIKASTRKRLRSNRRDHEYIKIVMLSDRKLGLSNDNKLRYDINNFPGHSASAGAHPSEIDYCSGS